MKRSALVGVKLAVSAALLAYLFSSTDIRALEQRVRSADLLMLVAAVFCYVAMLALATWRWRLLLETLGVDAPLRRLTSSYLVATFFNNFLPSNIGGDVVRVRDGSRLTGSTTASLAVVGIDRILGFGALYVLAAAAFVLGGSVERELAGARVVLGGLALAVPGPRLHLLPPGHRPQPAGGVAARPLSLVARAVRDGAGRRAQLPLARRHRRDGARRQPRAPGTRGLVLRLDRACAAHPATGVRRLPHGPAVLAAAGRARSRSTAGACARACSRCTSPRWGCRATAPSPSPSLARA